MTNISQVVVTDLELYVFEVGLVVPGVRRGDGGSALLGDRAVHAGYGKPGGA